MILLDHLLAILVVLLVALGVIVAFELGRRAEWRRRAGNSRWPHGVPVIRLDWANAIPVAIVESAPETCADVAAWLDAAKQGPVLRA